MGFPNPLDNRELTILKRGISRIHGEPPKQKLPITPKILSAMHLHLGQSGLDQAFECACFVGFHGFFRKATLLSRSASTAGRQDLSRKDVELKDNVAYITIRYSKTIQFGQRILTVPLCGVEGSPLCPVNALKKLLAGLPDEPDLPLFSFYNVHGKFSSLNYSISVKCLKAALQKAGVNPDQ